jgi:hypothetical protein
MNASLAIGIGKIRHQAIFSGVNDLQGVFFGIDKIILKQKYLCKK